jgi:hypothetical protein
MVFGYYASSIGRTFFPNENAFASLLLALMTFGAGFLMRPIGGVTIHLTENRRPTIPRMVGLQSVD